MFAVIAAGGLMLAGTLASSPPLNPLSLTIYAVLTVLASTVRVGLPAVDGACSLTFLPLLYGVAHFCSA